MSYVVLMFDNGDKVKIKPTRARCRQK